MSVHIRIPQKPLVSTRPVLMKAGRQAGIHKTKMKLDTSKLPMIQPRMVGGKPKITSKFNGRPTKFNTFVNISQTAQLRPHIARGVYDYHEINRKAN